MSSELIIQVTSHCVRSSSSEMSRVDILDDSLVGLSEWWQSSVGSSS